MSDLSKRTILITGTTSGIGRAAAIELARQGHRVILHGPSPQAMSRASQAITDAVPEAEVDQLAADFSSLARVRALARDVAQRYGELDVLINNAAATFPQRRVDEKGVELTFSVNHLAPYLLTRLLLPTLDRSGRGRVVVVASEAHRGARLDLGDLNPNGRYVRFHAYQRSKLANLLFTYELQRQLDGSPVTVNAMHPGTVATKLFPPRNPIEKLVMKALDRRALTPEEGCDTIVWLATSADVEESSGHYYALRQRLESSAESYDEDRAERLWDVSAGLTGLDA